MRSLYRVIKSGQTVLGEGRVPAYQMTGPETAQAEEISGEPGNAAREACLLYTSDAADDSRV